MAERLRAVAPVGRWRSLENASGLVDRVYSSSGLFLNLTSLSKFASLSKFNTLIHMSITQGTYYCDKDIKF
jgi:hypothetical protein